MRERLIGDLRGDPWPGDLLAGGGEPLGGERLGDPLAGDLLEEPL